MFGGEELPDKQYPGLGASASEREDVAALLADSGDSAGDGGNFLVGHDSSAGVASGPEGSDRTGREGSREVRLFARDHDAEALIPVQFQPPAANNGTIFGNSGALLMVARYGRQVEGEDRDRFRCRGRRGERVRRR